MMFVKDSIEELVRRLNLRDLASTRNNNAAGSKDAHCNSLALALSFSRTLSLTEVLALADANPWISCIIEELGIDALVNGFLEHAEQIVFVQQDLVDGVLIDVLIEGIVSINELNGEALNNGRSRKWRLRELTNGIDEPLHRLASKGFRCHTRHLNASIGEELDIHLLPLIACPVHLSPKNNGRLIEESLGGDFSIRENVFVT